MVNPTHREQVFFSYSRKDKKWLELFQATLKPYIRANQLSVWDDTKIKAGDVWRDEIKRALSSAKVAVILVSTNLLNSDFIAEHELPPLLDAAQREGLRILLVVVGHSLFEDTELGRYQTVNDPSRPLASISAASREKEVVRICREIKAAVTSPPEVKSCIDTEETISRRRPSDYLTIDIQAPDGTLYAESQIPYEYTVQDILNEVVKAFNLPLSDGGDPINYSLVSNGVTLSFNRTLPEAGIKNGDLIRLISSHPPTVYPASAHLHNLG